MEHFHGSTASSLRQEVRFSSNARKDRHWKTAAGISLNNASVSAMGKKRPLNE